MKKYKKLLITISIFLFFLFLNLFINQIQNDEIWNYGFAHNIYKGLIPYKDFNMVLTPLYSFIMSIPFHIFGSNILVFHITNSIILTITTLLLYKMIDNKIYIIGIIIVFFSNSITFPSYNLFSFFLIILIYYLETKKSNEYLIGILIGLLLLTKQSVGFFVLLPSIYYIKDKKKVLKRIIGFIIPCLLFLVYLLITNSLNEFLDLCLFGLFDFGTKNKSRNIIGYIIFILVFIFNIYLIIKDKKNIGYYYSLAFLSMAIPLFDYAHTIVPILLILIVYFMNHNIKDVINYKISFYIITVLIFIISFYRYNYNHKIIYPNNINRFEYRFIRDDSIKLTNEVIKYINDNKDENIIFLNTSAYYFRLITNKEISYIDLTNNGNFGYNGSKKMIKEIDKYNGSIFFINMDEYKNNVQTDKKSIEYVINNGEKIGKIQIFDIYRFNR